MPKEVDAVTKLYDFLLWVVPKLEKFPRSQKFLLADRIESHLLDLLEMLVEASYTKNKGVLLRRANRRLQSLRYLVRLAKDMKCLPMNSYEYAARAMNDIGTSIGGWTRYVNREVIQKPV